MKTLRTKMLLLLIVLSTATFAGKEEKKSTSMSKIEVVPSDNHIFRLVYKSEETNKVSVKILDSSAHLLFSETLNKMDGFSRPYNLKELPVGTYTFLVEDAAGEMKYTVERFESKPQDSIYLKLKKVTSMKDCLQLTMVSNGQAAPIVNIYDSSENLVYSKRESFSKQFSKLYNVGNTNSDFVFEIVSGNTVKRLNY